MKYSWCLPRTACCVAVLATLYCIQVSAQVITRPDDAQTESKPPLTGDGQSNRPSAADSPADTDEAPAMRNPFWTIGWQPDSSSVVTSAKDPHIGSPLQTRVDWPDTTKYVRETAKVSLIGANIIVVFEGKTYDIGQVLQVTRKGYTYGLKLMEGATLAPQWVHPAGN